MNRVHIWQKQGMMYVFFINCPWKPKEYMNTKVSFSETKVENYILILYY